MAIDIKNLNTISSSKYDIYTKLLDLAAASEYVTTRDNFNNVDFIKSGLFGYVTESMAMIMRDSSFHKTMIYRENFLNTAIMPQSIYNWAKTFNVDTIDAVPSSRYAIFTISTADIDAGIQNASSNVAEYQDKYGIVESGSFIVLDKTNPIIAGEHYFTLEHSIEIYKNPRGAYIVKYCVNEKDKTTEFGNYKAQIISSQYKTEGSNTYLTFKARVFQYKINEISKIITGSSFLDIRNHIFNYTGQLCGLALTYTKGGVTENVDLKFSNISKEEDETATNKVAYYSLTDEGTIEISFVSNMIGGLPQAGGVLNLRTFVTEGSSGNINYNGDAVFVISQEDFKVLSVNVVLDSTILTSGVDQSTLQNIKNTIINRLSLRNTIITENDLNIWFQTQSQLLENTNNSNITFRKEKDNLLKRTFSAFLLLRDGVELSDYETSTADSSEMQTASKSSSSYLSNVVPTNTIDVVYDVSTNTDETTANADYILIDPNKDISYNLSSQEYNYNSVSTSNTDFVYRSPFYININTTNNLISYLYLESDTSTAINFSDIQALNDISIIPLNVEVSYTHDNNISTDTDSTTTANPIRFRFYFNSDTDLTTISLNTVTISFGQNRNITLDPNSLKFVKVDQTDDSTETETQNYYLEIVAHLDKNIFNLKNTDTASINVNFGNDGTDNQATTSIFETTPIILSLESNSTSVHFNFTIRTEKDVQIFSSLDDVMSSDLVINKDADGNILSYTIKDVPVVARYWHINDINKEWFIKQLSTFINMLKENTDRLETTTFFNIKFRNTYGISRYYNSLTTNIRLKLTIYLKADAINSYTGAIVGSSTVQEALEKEIRDYVRVLVDQSNQEGTFVLSKIIMNVQAAYYNYVDHIDFNGLNGTFNQYINKINTTDTKYPLEYINLDNTSSSDGTSINYRLNEDIKFETI